VGWFDVRDCYVGEGSEHEAMVNGAWPWFLQCTGQDVFVVEMDFGAEPDTVNAGVSMNPNSMNTLIKAYGALS
jgi:hypothetical protein